MKVQLPKSQLHSNVNFDQTDFQLGPVDNTKWPIAHTAFPYPIEIKTIGQRISWKWPTPQGLWWGRSSFCLGHIKGHEDEQELCLHTPSEHKWSCLLPRAGISKGIPWSNNFEGIHLSTLVFATGNFRLKLVKAPRLHRIVVFTVVDRRHTTNGDLLWLTAKWLFTLNNSGFDYLNGATQDLMRFGYLSLKDRRIRVPHFFCLRT